MDSFYGGKQGISFVIKARFSSINDMMTAFEDPEYKSVWYGEYCLIDTENKFSPDNGKVYRRTLNTAGDPYSGYAEYVGQIVGPAGGVPKVILSNLDDIEAKHDTVTALDAVYYINGEGTIVTTHTASDNLKVYESTISAATTTAPAAGIVFKSGREYGTNVTPSLKYNWYNHTTTTTPVDGFGNTALNIGLEIPYVDMTVASAVTQLPYYQQPTFTETTGTAANQFDRHFTLSLPYGVPGAYINNMHITTISYEQTQTFYTLNQIQPTAATVTGETINYTVTGTPAITKTGGQVWLCDFVWYTGAAPTASNNYGIKKIENIYLSDCKPIENISLVGDINDKTGESDTWNASADRQITITYPDNNSVSIGSGINYIQDMVCGDNGHLYVLFNDPAHRNISGSVMSDNYYREEDGTQWCRSVSRDNGQTYSNNFLPYKKVWYRDYGDIVPDWGVYAQIIAIDGNQTNIHDTGFSITAEEGNTIAVTKFQNMAAVSTPTGSPKEQGWYIMEGTVTGNHYYLGATATAVETGVNYYSPTPATPIGTQYWLYNNQNETWIQAADFTGNPNFVGLYENTGYLSGVDNIQLMINAIDTVTPTDVLPWV